MLDENAGAGGRECVPLLTILPEKVEIPNDVPPSATPTKMPSCPAEIVPELMMPPEKVEIFNDMLLAIAMPPTKMPSMLAAIVPELVIPLTNVEIVSCDEWLASLPPTKMPWFAAEIVPELVMPPAKVVSVIKPPSKLHTDNDAGFARAEIAPELVMPPRKVAIDNVRRLPCATVDPDALKGRNRAGIADAAGEGRDRQQRAGLSASGTAGHDTVSTRRDDAGIADAAREGRDSNGCAASRYAADSNAALMAEMVPELLMPPEKVKIVPTSGAVTVPPTPMPFVATAEIVPELVMPLANVEIMTDPPPCNAADHDPGSARRDRAGIADAAAEGRDRGLTTLCGAADKDAVSRTACDRTGIVDAAGKVRNGECSV